MFERILVPLDGSKLAECALAYAETLAKSCQVSEVILISVTEQVKGIAKTEELRKALRESDKIGLGETIIDVIPSISYPATSNKITESPGSSPHTRFGTTVSFGKMEEQAAKYLTRIGKKLKAKGIPVKNEVLIGNPAEQITGYAEENEIDLIIMASHGRSGPSRWAMGSVSDKVFRATCIPVLLIRAPGCFPGVY
ncbi:MAG: universal stress protein [Dehalococcoidales bacterium]|nr:universal stress protein [Dehalococcoidales bacterium]